MTIPFTKAHGARNDFLLTWAHEAPGNNRESIAVAICDRQTGPGGDGWIVVTPESAGVPHAAIELWNSDGSKAEISGNGTRCAAALLVQSGYGREFSILTGAGLKTLRLVESHGNRYSFEMNMGTSRLLALSTSIDVPGGPLEASILDVGNPQCAIFVDDFAFDWCSAGAALESHPLFPNRTNVSFVRVRDRHTIDVRFYERGAGVTMSSGTGSTGAFAAALARGLVLSPVTVLTPAGPLQLSRQGESILLTGPAEIVVRGEFYRPPE